jgi:molybdate transport system substrate-binding protein
MIKTLSRFALILLTVQAFTLTPVFAQNLKVAIAANLQPVMKALQKDFKTKSGVSIDVISGPSGGLTTQIRNGAPFDVFLSADMSFPETLHRSGFALQKPVVYAQGVLIVCSTQKLDFSKWARLITTPAIEKIAIGNPVIAPYGKAAVQSLKKAGVYNKVESKIVLGESITHVNTYITTGSVQVGFTTLALVKDPANKKPLRWFVIDPKTYAPIQQGMVILKHGKGNANAEKFYTYMLSANAKSILKTYGYHVQ